MFEKLLSFIGKLQHDKALHVLAGVIIFSFAHNISMLFFIDKKLSNSLAFICVFAVASCKEIYDYFHRNHTPDRWDLVATMWGGLIGLSCSLPLVK